MNDASNQGADAKSDGGEAKSQARVSLFGRRARARAAAEPPPPPAARPPRRPRRTGLSGFSGFLSFVLLGALVGFGLFVWAMIEVRKPGPLQADKVVVIEREDDGGPIGDQLERAGVIDSAIWLSAMTLIDGNRGALKRGEYDFRAHVSLRQVEAELMTGKVVLHSITIPEGLTSDQVVERLRENDILVGEIKEPPREGSILPETYKFARGETRQALLSVMQKAQGKVVDEIWAKRAPDLPIKSPGELVTLASIVEKETGKADERPRVAGVFVNRLQKHMKLQSDPTIVYGLVFGKGTLGHSITRAELDQATPYNTYNIEGLPPGPICNPGRAALEAAASPLRSKELYFVADGTGGHAFAETLDQHLKNVAHWRQIEQDSKDRLAPDAMPTPAGTPPAKHGALDPPDPAMFGAIAPAGAPSPADRGGALGAKLAKLGEKLRAREALLGAGGALSPNKVSGQTPEALGAVVTGVNDAPTGPVFSDAADPDTDGSLATMTKVPLSPAALAEQRAREARYAGAASAGARVAGLDPSSAAPRPRAFDASEGTALDPLRNKTFDLNFAKTVPPLD
jgi:UPF0755 protein